MLFKNTIQIADIKVVENSYLLFDEKSKEAVIIDPGAKNERMETRISTLGLKVLMVLNTHGHRDHSAANRYYAKKYGCQVMGSKEELPLYSGDMSANTPDRFYPDSGICDIGSFKIKVIGTPGHTPGSVALLINGTLFSGDTLAWDAIGKIRGKTREEIEGKRSLLIKTIKEKLLTLDDRIRVFSGHGTPTRIGREKRFNRSLKTTKGHSNTAQ